MSVITSQGSPNVSPPTVNASQGRRLAVPQPGINMRPSVSVSQVTQTPQPQGTAHVRTVQSSVETQTSS